MTPPFRGINASTKAGMVQIAADSLIPLLEPARWGAVDTATDVVAATDQAVAGAAYLRPTELRSVREQRAPGVLAEQRRIARFQSITKTEEVDQDEPDPIGSLWRQDRRGTM